MQKRSNIAVALILIALGAWFLLVQLVPALESFSEGRLTWPLQIVGAGAVVALIALVTWTPELLAPAFIVAGVGGLLYYQNQTGDWASWAYAWALIPGFAGLGTLVAGLLRNNRRVMVGAAWAIFNSLVLFAIFSAFLGGPQLIGQYWPVLLILLGILIAARGLERR